MWARNRNQVVRTKAAGLLIVLALSVGARSETVDVKYRGLVDLDRFACNETASSFVNRICYQEAESYLIVLLRATYYHHCGVPTEIVDGWRRAPSKGRFYNANVKGKYDCRLGGIPDR